MGAPSAEAEAWAASGAMALTGRRDQPALVPPDGIVARILDLGRRLQVDSLGLLAERAADAGLTRQGPWSCGGSALLLATADGWLVVNLARDDDRASVPAWLELDGAWDPEDPWPTISQQVSGRSASDLVARGALLGLPIARLGEAPAELPDSPDREADREAIELAGLPVGATRIGPAAPLDRPHDGVLDGLLDGLLVVDLSSLWAGPLCSRLLTDGGARVVKVESTSRPDGARRGVAAFFDRLQAGKRSVGLDLATEEGCVALRRLLDVADVVVEASRPRALRGLGIDATDVLADGRCRAWVSITGFGRRSDRVAFGDDAAVAGGLVAFDEQGPCFAADAIADPLAGMVAAAAVDAALTAGGRWLLDVSMAAVAAHVAGADRLAPWRSDERLTPRAPRLDPPLGPARSLGADNDLVAAELGVQLP